MVSQLNKGRNIKDIGNSKTVEAAKNNVQIDETKEDKEETDSIETPGKYKMLQRFQINNGLL